MSLELENELEEAENILREAGYPYPIAWALGWFLDNEELLIRVLHETNNSELAKQVDAIVGEIRTAL